MVYKQEISSDDYCNDWRVWSWSSVSTPPNGNSNTGWMWTALNSERKVGNLKIISSLYLMIIQRILRKHFHLFWKPYSFILIHSVWHHQPSCMTAPNLLEAATLFLFLRLQGILLLDFIGLDPSADDDDGDDDDVGYYVYYCLYHHDDYDITIMIIKTYWHDDGGLLPVLFIQGLSHLFHLSHVRLAKKDTRPQKSEGTQQQRSKKMEAGGSTH